MLSSCSTDRRSRRRTHPAGSRSRSLSPQPSLFRIKSLLGCGYVGNKDVVHISTGQHYDAGPFSTHRFLGRPIFLADNMGHEVDLLFEQSDKLQAVENQINVLDAGTLKTWMPE